MTIFFSKFGQNDNFSKRREREYKNIGSVFRYTFRLGLTHIYIIILGEIFIHQYICD